MRRAIAFVLPFLGSLPLVAQDPELAEECTIGVAAGAATADGRPLLWKNRDARQRDNVVLALADGRIPYFALCDAGNTQLAWGGANVAGFAIVNAVSRDLPASDGPGPANGAFVKRALQECESVAAFAELLRATDGARRTRGNFAVVDAHGGAAIFEAGPARHQRFDAHAAAGGVLVRTNFATTGGGERGRERFARAEALCTGPLGKAMTPRFLLQQLLRDLQPPPSAVAGAQHRLDTRETIHRQSTVAGLVVHGVKAGDDPRWTVVWALLGPPLFTIAVPLFPAAGAVPPAIAGEPRSVLCDRARELADRCHVDAAAGAAPVADDPAEPEAAGPLRWLRTDALAPVRRAVLFAEAEILARHDEALANWQRASEPRPALLRAFQEAMAKLALQRLNDLAVEPAAAGK